MLPPVGPPAASRFILPERGQIDRRFGGVPRWRRDAVEYLFSVVAIACLLRQRTIQIDAATENMASLWRMMSVNLRTAPRNEAQFVDSDKRAFHIAETVTVAVLRLQTSVPDRLK